MVALAQQPHIQDFINKIPDSDMKNAVTAMLSGNMSEYIGENMQNWSRSNSRFAGNVHDSNYGNLSPHSAALDGAGAMLKPKVAYDPRSQGNQGFSHS